MDEKIREKVIELDKEIGKLERLKEDFLSSQELTTKEHYEFYHG